LLVLGRALAVAALLFVFLCGIKALGDGFKLLGKDALDAFFSATDNPFIALMVGILGTTLVQSSSVSTSMIVALVAAPDNPLPLANAIPMVMGANIGTTVTNTLASMAHMTRREEFRRAFAVATCHDFFNFMTVAVLLPIELTTHYLQRSATYITAHLGDLGGVTYESPLKAALKTAVSPVKRLAEALFDSQQAQAILIILFAAVAIVVSLLFLVRTMRTAVGSGIELFITRFLGRSLLLSVVAGIMVTVAVQSSSITTSLLVPLAGAGIVTLEAAFPVTVGANIGTTVTALLASLATSGANAGAGLTIAVVHLLFNLTGTLMILPFPPLRRIPMIAARRLADLAVNSRQWAVVYVMILFYGLPALFAYLIR
jgi:sodium-dependent phosphate cotransporter